MSRTIKDAVIMGVAAGSVGLLVAGAEIGLPVVAGVAVAAAVGATIAKLIETAPAQSPAKRVQDEE